MSDCDRDDVYDATSGVCQGRMNCPRQQTAGGVGELSLAKQGGSRGEDGAIELGENLARIITSVKMSVMKAIEVCIELASLAFSILFAHSSLSSMKVEGCFSSGVDGVDEVGDVNVKDVDMMKMMGMMTWKSDVARYDSTRSRIGSAGCQVGNIKWCRKLPSFWADCDDGRLDHGKRKPVDGQVVS